MSFCQIGTIVEAPPLDKKAGRVERAWWTGTVFFPWKLEGEKLPTQAEEQALAAVQEVLAPLNVNDRFRVLARLNENSNQLALRNERDEFAERRARILAEKRAARVPPSQ